ncbi:hypothetical protein OY671_008607, partial [Metschnikowia pulcherrima]
MPQAATPAWLKFAPALFSSSWSSGFVVSKVGSAYADPMTFSASRYACVVASSAPFSSASRPPSPRGASAWGHSAMVGSSSQAGYFCFTYSSLKQGMSAGGSASITSSQPISIGLSAPVIAHERVDARRWAGSGSGVSGAASVIIAKASVDSPDTSISSATHQLNEKWESSGDISWTGWSSIPDSKIRNSGTGARDDDSPSNFRDTWRIAVGTSYKFAPDWKWKFGSAYDQSPVHKAEDRPTSSPDNDRYWFSTGVQ